VALNFDKLNQKFLDRMTLTEAKKYYEEDHFPPGQHGPQKSKSSSTSLKKEEKKLSSRIQRISNVHYTERQAHILYPERAERTTDLLAFCPCACTINRK
jgi:carbamate kinase